MRNMIRNFIKAESGATAIEYAFIASLIAMVCVATLGVVGTKLNAKFTLVSDGLN
ncbi:MAG TPA: Flp family type IVb pilin [Rhodoblastus sp.]|nr:Flp family type IVb pilin [Rhodoblastus sp.]